jgi:hypothetical protein
LEYARANPKEFIQFGLSRLWPAPQREDDFQQQNIQINNYSDARGIAARVAFALSVGMHGDPAVQREPDAIEGEVSPQEACRPDPWQTVPNTAPLLRPEPVDNPDRDRWIEELPLTDEGRKDAALIRETREVSITNYRGGDPAEMGHSTVRSPSSPDRDPRGEQRARMLSRRRDQLL